MDKLKIDYVELETSDLGLSKAFFNQAFGWTYVDYGTQYADIENAGLGGGLSVAGEAGPKPALVILKADDLEAAQKQVEAAGGVIVREIFSFPGGRRFHFSEPGGNELAVWSQK